MFQGDDGFKVLDRVVVEKGTNIFREGDGGMRAYVVQSGAVEIWRDIDGERVVYATIGEGGIFGEMALIDSKPRMAAARAAVGTTIICVTRQMFEEKLRKSDPFIRGLLNILADDIRSISNN